MNLVVYVVRYFIWSPSCDCIVYPQEHHRRHVLVQHFGETASNTVEAVTTTGNRFL